MIISSVTIHELIAWELDDYSYRIWGKDRGESALACARKILAQRDWDAPRDALVDDATVEIQRLIAAHAERPALYQEYEGLDWSLGIVDLHHLLAFQRRLVFDPDRRELQTPQQEDWPALFSLCLGTVREAEYSMSVGESDESCSEFRLQSSNPDLQLRPILAQRAGELAPFTLYGGSPFFEVAEFRGRWFLRDGYHRAYRLLQAGVRHVPAVVIRARTMEEVGAIQPWFFHERELFSDRPPLVVDFLEKDLVLSYQRRRFIKTIRVRIEETLEPVREIEEIQGDDV